MSKRKTTIGKTNELIRRFERSSKAGKLEGGLGTMTRKFVPLLAELAKSGNGVQFKRVVDAYLEYAVKINEKENNPAAKLQALDVVETLCHVADVRTGYQELSHDDRRQGVPEGIASHQFWRIYSGQLARDGDYQSLLKHEIRIA